MADVEGQAITPCRQALAGIRRCRRGRNQGYPQRITAGIQAYRIVFVI